jgi:hypothetical protein
MLGTRGSSQQVLLSLSFCLQHTRIILKNEEIFMKIITFIYSCFKRISDADKAVVKSRMVEYMCNMPPSVQRQMSEALSIISKHDFPERWTEV